MVVCCRFSVIGPLRFRILGMAILLLLSSLSFAETTCTHNGCDITITIKIAFAGADNAYINKAENEIESVWNGPNGFRTIGDCKCKMKVDVQTMKTADCVNNPPAGYHCVTVTNFFNPAKTAYDNPPRNQTNISGAALYVGYLYGTATGNGGNSIQGWWSDQMSRPSNPANPAAGNYNDFAHEAGHLMGLDHNNNAGSLMNNTLAGPTQDDIENAAKNICGPNPCPDSCCCGNGVVDRNKGEGCDPLAKPSGCNAGESCCPVCCHCYMLPCVAANGEYPTLSSCQSGCGLGASCYKNYKTSCWDCVKQTVVVTGTCRDPTNIRGNPDCDHPGTSFPKQMLGAYDSGFINLPVVGGIFANERINIRTIEGDEGFLITQNGIIMSSGAYLLKDPTVTISTDRLTLGLLAGGQISAQQALATGRIRIEGNDLASGIKFGFYNVLLGIHDFFSPPPEFVPPAEEPEYPPEYYNAMEEWNEARGSPPSEGPVAGIGEVPDKPHTGTEIWKP